MSIRMIALAWELQLPSTKKLVLLALCDWSNDLGFCFPSIASVARRSGISKRQCQRIMAELIDDGLVTVAGNLHGGARSRRYQLNLSALREGGSTGIGDKLTPVTKVVSTPVTMVGKTGDMDVIRTANNRHLYPPLHSRSGHELDWTYLPSFTTAEKVVVVDILNGIDAAQHQNVIDELAGALRAMVIKGPWPAWLRGLATNARAEAFIIHHGLAIQHDRQREAEEAADAEARRIATERLCDPAVRAGGFKAMNAAAAEIGFSRVSRGTG